MYILKNIETYEVNICLPDQNNKKKKGGVGKVLLILLAVVSIIAIGVYIAGVIYFQQHFFYRTTVGNTDVSFMDVDSSIDTLTNSTKTYKIKVTAPWR